MSVLNIVLIEPQIPQNTGNIARTCAATGARLHLVGPLGFEITDAKLKRAGLDYWRLLDITTYESTPEFFSRNPRGEFYYFTTKARRHYTDIAYRTTRTWCSAGRTRACRRSCSARTRTVACACR